MSRNTLSITDNRTGKTYEVPIENNAISAMELRQIRVDDDDYGLKSYDPAFKNTASCKSRITFIDGEKGILRYRGYPIEQLAEKSNYLEVAYLILNGELPNKEQAEEWRYQTTHHTIIHEFLTKLLDGLGVEPDNAWMALNADFRERLGTGRPIDLKAPEHMPAEDAA